MFIELISDAKKRTFCLDSSAASSGKEWKVGPSSLNERRESHFLRACQARVECNVGTILYELGSMLAKAKLRCVYNNAQGHVLWYSS